MYTDNSSPIYAGRDFFDQELARDDRLAATAADLRAYMARLQKRLGELLEGALALPEAGPDEKLALYGAGAVGLQMLSFYQDRGRPPDCFVDSAPGRQGLNLKGRPVLAPAELPGLGHLRVVISVGRPAAAEDIAAGLVRLGLSADLVHNPHEKYGDLGHVLRLARNLEILAANFSRLEETLALLDDQRSRFVYLGAVKARFLWPDGLAPLLAAHFWEPNQYWALPAFRNVSEAVLVDCGAAYGEALESFLANTPAARVRKIQAFEPFPKNFPILLKKARALETAFNLPPGSIDCHNCAVGERSSTGYVRSGGEPGMLSRRDVGPAGEGARPFDIVSLDEAVPGPVSVIKADIEGFELDMLKGAAGLIRRCRPRLAVCLYHEPEDVYTIPLFIRELVPEYRLAVRHHNEGPFETVLYAWIPEEHSPESRAS